MTAPGTFRHAPLTLPFEDYAETEKIAYLSRQLTTQGAPRAWTRTWGYQLLRPWGNLAIFYRDFGYSTGLIKLGRIESGLDALTTQPSGTSPSTPSNDRPLQHQVVK